MKKIFLLLALWALGLPAPARDKSIPLEPDAMLRSKYHVYERAGVAAGQGAIVAASVRGWLVKTDASGKVYWRVKSPCSPACVPAIEEQMVVYACENGKMLALDLADGKQLWQFAFNDSVASGPAFHEQLLIFQTGDGRVIALDKQDGKIKWLTRQLSRSSLSMRAAASPLVLDDIIYIGMADGNLAALKADNGEPVWQRRIFDKPITSDLDFPLLADDKAIYASSLEGLCAVSRTSGKNYWCIDEKIAAPPVQDENNIYALNTANELMLINKLAGIVEKRVRVKESALAKAEHEKPLAIYRTDQELFILFNTKLVRMKSPDYSPKTARIFILPVQRAEKADKTMFMINSRGYLEISHL
jgi:outer membrane protein assembly factor BamB